MLLLETHKVSNCLKRIFLRAPSILLTGKTRFNNELNDLLPSNYLERFLVSSAFESPRFISSLRLGKLSLDDISQIESFLSEQLGFNETTTKWICDVWAGAFDLVSHKLPTKFACPNCNREEHCNPTWRDRMVICPCCNSTIHFSHTLVPTITKAGWPKKRTRNRNWVVLPITKYNSEMAIKSAISKLLEDENLSAKEIAEYIGLPAIVSSLQSEIEILLNDRAELSQKCQSAIATAVTEVLFGESIQPKTAAERKNELVDYSFLNLDNNEHPILMLNPRPAEGGPCLAFTSCAVHYRASETYFRVPYCDLPQLQITREQCITDLRIGISRLISTKGLGVTRASVILALSIIQKCIQASAEECT